MEIAKYFERISKIRDLSYKWSNEEASKKFFEGSLDNSASSDVSVSNEDPFIPGVCKYFNELYAEFRKKFGHIFKILEKTEDRQIKGEFQLTDWAKSVDFITQKFEENEKERREKDAIITTLQSKLKSASMKLENLEKKLKGKNSTPGEIVL